MTASPTSTARCSLVIVSYNSTGHLPRLFQSIDSHHRGHALELIAVDNASDDRGRLDEIVGDVRGFSDKRIVRNDTNLGFAAAANIGAAAATGDVVLFLNPDTVWLTPLADRLCDVLERPGAPMAATARLEFPDGSFQANCRRFPTASNLLFSRGSPLERLRPVRAGHGGPARYTLGDFAVPTAVPAASATALAIRRETFWRLGGFDPGYFLYVEDTDLCRRIAQAGGTTWFVPDARACHDWPGHAPDRWRRYLHRRGIIRYFRKFRGDYPIGSSWVKTVIDSAFLLERR